MNPVLTIGIPTYNGAKSIARALIEISKQINGDERVELVISDNASTDNLLEVIAPFLISLGSRCRYIKNESNVGFDLNVVNIVNNAKGDYVWFISDDDYPAPKAIKTVVDAIEYANPVDFIFVNFPGKIQIDKKCSNSRLNGDDFFKQTKFKSGLISSSIISRKTWQGLNMQQYAGCQWIHFAYAVYALAPTRRGEGLIIPEMLIIENGAPRWGEAGSFINVGLKLANIFRGMTAIGYKSVTQNLGLKAVSGAYPWAIIRAKAQGLVVTDCIRQQFQICYGHSWVFWLLHYPSLLLPKWLCYCIYDGKQSFVRLLKLLYKTARFPKRAA